MTVNNPSEPEIQISEEKLQKLGWILFGLAVIFTIIGAFVSPLDDQGKPVLLLPEHPNKLSSTLLSLLNRLIGPGCLQLAWVCMSKCSRQR